jgi:peptidoglycan hydrolase CwlO-like protein
MIEKSAPKISRAQQTLQALYEALVAEQKAVSRLDSAALDRAQAEKQRLSAELAQLGAPPAEEADAFRAAADRVLRQARANAALLADASSLMAARLGVSAQPMTYDSRARMRSHYVSTVSRAF